MCVVIDLDAVCLVCLQPSKEKQSIFTSDVDSSELQIAQKISILSELKIDQNNHTLPSKICVKCLQDLKAAWRFRKNCQAAVTIFQTIVSMDVEQTEEASDNQDIVEKKVNDMQGLQTKSLERKTNENEKSSTDILACKKVTLEEYVIVNDKDDNTNLFEEYGTQEQACRQEEEANQFASLSEVGEVNEEDDDDENNLVEYYLNEEGISEELSIKVATELDSNLTMTNKQNRNKKLNAETDTKPLKLTEFLVKVNKPIQRGRPRTKTKQQADELQNPKRVMCRIKKEEEENSNENKRKTSQILPVRQVKSRKKKSSPPDSKPPKICEICGNSYRFQHALNAHMRRHFNEKPFPCEFCDKAFVSNVELRRHIRVHTGQKPYACQYCDRRFSDFGSRIKHERTHTGERPYVCGTCGKSFAYPHVLSVHLRTHTGEKKYRCDPCGKGFTKKVYLQSHVEQHHSGMNNYLNINEATSSSQEKCASSMEYENEEGAVDDNTEYEEEETYETSNLVLTTSSRVQIKEDDSNEEGDYNEDSLHEIVEVVPEEYTIRVR